MASTTATSGIDSSHNRDQSATFTKDPFADRRGSEGDNYAGQKLDNIAGSDAMRLSPSSPSPTRDRRMSKEWDATKVPPSRFQKRAGSIYSTPGSRDGHVKGSTRDQAYHDKLKEKGWSK